MAAEKSRLYTKDMQAEAAAVKASGARTSCTFADIGGNKRTKAPRIVSQEAQDNAQLVLEVELNARPRTWIHYQSMSTLKTCVQICEHSSTNKYTNAQLLRIYYVRCFRTQDQTLSF